MQYENRNGLCGTAGIPDFSETNGRVSGNPILKFELELNDGCYPQRKSELNLFT